MMEISHSRGVNIMMSEFDIVFDAICEDVFPKIDSHIDSVKTQEERDYVEIHELIDFLTDVEGYDTDMATRIWETYQYNNPYQNLLRRKADAV